MLPPSRWLQGVLQQLSRAVHGEVHRDDRPQLQERAKTDACKEQKLVRRYRVENRDYVKNVPEVLTAPLADNS